MGANPFEHSTYLFCKQFFKLFGGSFRIYDPAGSLVLFASMKAFKLKENIAVYSDEGKANELFRIKARSIIDFSAVYDVIDSSSGQKVGAFKRRGLKSMLKDEWIIMDAHDNEIGIIREDSWLLALIRRFALNIIPQSYQGEVGATPAFTFKQSWNPFIHKMALDFSADITSKLDRRLGIAAAVLLGAIEGKQD